MLPWAQQRLRELLGGVEVPSSTSTSTPSASSSASSFVTGANVETSGEAIVNSRKGKLIPAYELTLKGTWKESEAGNSRGGDWEIYLADENQGEDPDVKATVPPQAAGAGEAAEDAARAFRDAAKAYFAPKLRDFVKELAAGGGGSEGASASAAAAAAEEKAAAPAAKSEPAAEKKAVPAAPAAPAAPPPPKPAAAPSSRDAAATTTLKLTEKFYCRPSDLFEALTDRRKVMAFTQAPAEIDGPPFEPGSKYSIFAGAVDARFAEGTDPEKHRIELEWRFKEVKHEDFLFFFFLLLRAGRKAPRPRERKRRRKLSPSQTPS